MRDELPYTMRMIGICREELDKIIEWYIGLKNDFKVDAGKFGKYFKKYLPKNFFEMYEKTYFISNYENLWKAIFIMCDLFRILAQKNAEKLNFEYNQIEGNTILKYLKRLKTHSKKPFLPAQFLS